MQAEFFQHFTAVFLAFGRYHIGPRLQPYRSARKWATGWVSDGSGGSDDRSHGNVGAHRGRNGANLGGDCVRRREQLING